MLEAALLLLAPPKQPPLPSTASPSSSSPAAAAPEPLVGCRLRSTTSSRSNWAAAVTVAGASGAACDRTARSSTPSATHCGALSHQAGAAPPASRCRPTMPRAVASATAVQPGAYRTNASAWAVSRAPPDASDVSSGVPPPPPPPLLSCCCCCCESLASAESTHSGPTRAGACSSRQWGTLCCMPAAGVQRHRVRLMRDVSSATSVRHRLARPLLHPVPPRPARPPLAHLQSLVRGLARLAAAERRAAARPGRWQWRRGPHRPHRPRRRRRRRQPTQTAAPQCYWSSGSLQRGGRGSRWGRRQGM